MTTESLRSSLIGHEAFVRRVARALTRDWNEAEDLVQETWAYALARQPDPADLKPWLAATVRGLGLNRRRAERRRKERERLSASPESVTSPTELLGLRQEVVNAVLRLDEPFRTTITLAYAEGLSPAEIAVRESVAPGTVRSRLHRAHALLERDLGTREGGARPYAILAGPAGLTRASASAGLPATSAWVFAVVAACAGLFVLTLGLKTRESSEPRSIEGRPPKRALEAGVATTVQLTGSVELAAPQESGRKTRQAAIVPTEHPFWRAVRDARQAAAPLKFTQAPEDIETLERLSLPASLPELPAASLTVLVQAITSPLGVTAVVSPHAEDLGAGDLEAVQWACPVPSSGTELLDLYCSGGSGKLAWEVRRGVLHVGTWETLGQEPLRHVHPIADLLLDPRDYFDETPASLAALPISGGDLATLLSERLGESAKVQGSPIEAKGRGIEISHAKPAHLIASAYLDSLRGFWLPLPEKGIPGSEQRIERHPNDGAVLRAVAACGGPSALLPPKPGALIGHLRSTLAGKKIGALVSKSAVGAQPSDLRISVRAGYLYVRDVRESPVASPTSTLMMNLQHLLIVEDGAYQASPRFAVEAGHALIEEAAAQGNPLELTARGLEDFVRRRIAPESWDQDLRNTLRITSDGQLFVRQSPWAIDEIVILIRAIEST